MQEFDSDLFSFILYRHVMSDSNSMSVKTRSIMQKKRD